MGMGPIIGAGAGETFPTPAPLVSGGCSLCVYGLLWCSLLVVDLWGVIVNPGGVGFCPALPCVRLGAGFWISAAGVRG